jgi:hypothetical protein
LYDVPGQITGPTAQTGSGWSYSGGTLTVPAGAVLSNIRTDGSFEIVVTGAGATIKNSDIECSSACGVSWDIGLRHASNVTIINNNIHGVTQEGTGWCAQGITDANQDSANMTIENNNFWWCSNPTNNLPTQGGLVKNNYVHDFPVDNGLTTLAGHDCTTANWPGGVRPNDCPHYEAMQDEPGGGALQTIQDNTFLNNNADQTAAIILSNWPGGTENNILLNHNLLAGGGYSFYGSGCSGCTSTNVVFTNNHVSRIFTSTGGGYGPDVYWNTGNGNVWSGNVWDNTGASVQP